jgi:nitrite reductase (NO-forming)
MRVQKSLKLSMIFFMIAVFLLTSCAPSAAETVPPSLFPTAKAANTPTSQPVEAAAAVPDTSSSSSTNVVSFHLKTALGSAGMMYVGVGGDIDGVNNPDLKVKAGDTVEITLENGDGVQHDFSITEFQVMSKVVTAREETTKLTFTAGNAGEYAYFCSMPGHRQAGMEGKFIVEGSGGEAVQASSSVTSTVPSTTTYTAGMDMGTSTAPQAASVPADPNAVSIGRAPEDLPGPLPVRGPETIEVNMETVEVPGKLADGTTYTYWTFDGQVPGPFLRVRVGDTVVLTLTNNSSSTMAHSIDLHAVTGPGGGAAVTQAAPGESKTVTFKALNPGLYVYHCATPSVAQHIANGMFGLILVEPEGGLPKVDHEYYVMQSEIYTTADFGTTGHLAYDYQRMLDETPEYFVLNGSTTALTAEHPLTAKTGETVRIYFGVGGPNFTSSFHVIGEIFDRVYNLASITSDPLTDVQTTLVPPGGATVVEFQVQVPGRYLLVDHALSRIERGLLGFLMVEGDPVPEIFDGDFTPGSGH